MPDSPKWPLEFSPDPPLTPNTVADLAAMVQQASRDRTALFPLGGQTQIDLGLPPERSGVCVDLRRLDQVIDYPARDMTITVQAGITLARVQEVLAAENQRLPVDVSSPERATLGGALAANVSGPRRLGFGTFRDYVLGVSFINDEGQEVKSGGRVVKNVAGYDICKLVIGSLGTLGILSQVTLKVKPRPEQQTLVTIGCEATSLGALFDFLHGSRTRPVCIEAFNAGAAEAINSQTPQLLPKSAWVVVVGFEDNSEAAPWQAQQLIQHAPPGLCRDLDVRVGSVAQALWNALVEFAAWPEGKLTFKANMLPRAVADFCYRAEGFPHRLLLQAHAGSGIVIGHARESLTREHAEAMLTELLAVATQAAGNLILPRCPMDWKKGLPVWGRPRGDQWLMRRIKEKLDPKRLFNPGRFVDGL